MCSSEQCDYTGIVNMKNEQEAQVLCSCVPGVGDVPAVKVPPALPAVPGVTPEDTPWDAAYLAAAAEAAAAGALPDPARTITDNGIMHAFNSGR